jgi:WhiB family redox-sensing transcriptional regulator
MGCAVKRQQNWFSFLLREHENLPCQSAPQLFFEQDARGDEEALLTAQRFAMAKKLCNDCPIRQACLSYAIENNEVHGVWGQTTPIERKLIRMA